MGRRLEEKRKELNLSRSALARRAQVDLKTLTLLEEGKRDVRLSTLMKVADALQEPLEELVSGLELSDSRSGSD